ncbi:MAG: large ribosomal subunit protein bL35, partial [Pikeienuella sp.]
MGDARRGSVFSKKLGPKRLDSPWLGFAVRFCWHSLAPAPAFPYTQPSIAILRPKGLPRGLYTISSFKETEMPKMKTKSGAKKRFRLTANGKVRG